MDSYLLAREAIETLVSFEKELNGKLGLLTEISIYTQDEKILKACEEIREFLCSQQRPD